MADCLISPVLEIGKFICPFLKPHIDYWWLFDDNIQDLRRRIEKLMQRKGNIEEQRKLLVLHTDNLLRLDNWLKASTDKLEEARQILLLPNANIHHACNLISRYSLGKNAKKIAEGIEKLINEGEFNNAADPAPQPAMEYPFHGPIVDFKSRKSIEEGIIDSLKKSSVYLIGICGMGGVGKTTMARTIEERVKKENLFDEVVRVSVGQTMDVTKIQNEIAHSLKLKFDESNRADQLRTRLMDAHRKIIIFDDVWESLNFEELGFPIEGNFEKCKVLLTSRDRGTCSTIANQVVFDLENLGEEEAWILFKDKAGISFEDLNLEGVARNVAAECKGLPIALVTVGIALKDEKNIDRWNSSLLELKQGSPSDLTQVLKFVYKPLKLSYNCLEKEGKRNLFLMCCLFPKNYNIPIEQLTWYRMFGDNTIVEEKNIINIEDARKQTKEWVEELKRRSLLIAGEDKLHVKMDDLVRDMAIYIGSEKGNGFLKSLHRSPTENLSDGYCNWMSVDISNEQMEVPVLSRFRKLRLLMLSSNLSSNQFYNISFKGITDLKVLSFQNISIRSLPSTLANLQTLRLFGCGVEDISFIGKLTKLKILSCCRCDNITELPKEIGRLKGLRLLELSDCPRLQTIPSGVISSLSPLEELKILSSFSEWGTTGNASLTELEHLPNLTCLEIEISNCTLSAQEIRLSEKLVRYRIGISPKAYYGFKDTDYEKAMELNLPGAVGNWIQKLARKAEYLHLSADGSGNINLAEMEKLRELIFTDCSTVEKLVGINQNVSLGNLKSIYIGECSNLKHVFSVWVSRTKLLQLENLHIDDCATMEQVFCNYVPVNTDGCIEFPKLKELTLRNLPNLTALCQGLENIIIKFPNLTEIDIAILPKLKSLFPPYSKTDLSQLEVLRIKDCDSMEQVFWNEIKDNNTDGCIEFPKLKELTLENLPNLTAFYQGLESIKFPNLTKMEIHDLPKLNSLSPLNSETVGSHDQNTCFHLFCNPKFEMDLLKNLSLAGLHVKNLWCHQIPNNFFNNLERLKIIYIHGIKSLMSTSIAKTLVSLKYLNIDGCEEMVEVIEVDDDNDKQVVDINCLFPNLNSLNITRMPKLIRFWQWDHALELPLLEEINIYDCPAMETFTLGSVNTPNIKKIYVNIKYIEVHEDLNDAIHNIWTQGQDKSDGSEEDKSDGFFHRRRRLLTEIKMSTTLQQ